MGGHGGLNILPQKKWNVYNWDNREIVQKDKKQHQEKKRKQYQEKRSQLLDNKITMLKQEKGLPVYDQSEAKPKDSLISTEMKRLDEDHKHVNFFQQEERILLNKQLSEAKRLKEQEFLKDKNMDFSSRFLGTYNDEKHLPWYSRKKGNQNDKQKSRHFLDIDDMIISAKTESNITREVIEAEKRQAFRIRQYEERDRTRQKQFKRHEQLEDKCIRMETGKSTRSKQLVKHEQDLLVKQFRNDKESQLQRLRQKRLRREEKERKRAEELRKRMRQQH